MWQKKCPTNGWENSNWTISNQGECDIDYFDSFFHPLNMKLKLMCAPIHSSCSYDGVGDETIDLFETLS